MKWVQSNLLGSGDMLLLENGGNIKRFMVVLFQKKKLKKLLTL